MIWVRCVFLTMFLVGTACAQEVIVYGAGGSRRGSESFLERAGQIDVIAPQSYGVDSLGNVSGAVPQRLIDEALATGTRLMPLIMNPGFNQAQIHGLLANPDGRRRTVEFMVKEGIEKGFWGWQFDFENIHRSRKDAFTTFFREATEALHEAGMTASVAVVPTNDEAQEKGFSRYMQDNWRGNFDMAAIAEVGDFISLMTYAQHGGPTAPGPIAGLPWMKEMLDYALEQGVPPEKISLGLPFYSGYWHPDHFSNDTIRVRGREIGYALGTDLIEEHGVTMHWLPEQGVSYGFWQQNGVFRWLFLEDARAMEAKLSLFRAYPGLRGVSIWVLGAEDPRVWPLLKSGLN
ncbi:MAG: glycosyl hydrolase family 18 protein [Rhodothermales bacterium]|nr:glycosyl hydrolase family 18 protein [Rhodothermales bacterium]